VPPAEKILPHPENIFPAPPGIARFGPRTGGAAARISRAPQGGKRRNFQRMAPIGYSTAEKSCPGRAFSRPKGGIAHKEETKKDLPPQKYPANKSINRSRK